MNQEQLSSLIRNYLVSSVPGATLTRMLELHADSGRRAGDAVALLEANPAYGHFILGQRGLAQKIAQWTEEIPEGRGRELLLKKRIVGLLGKTTLRNLIASLRLARVIGAGMPTQKGEQITVQPSQMIPFALKTEDYCQDKKWVYPEISFIAGLHYDWLSALLARNKAPREAQEALQDAYREGFSIAQCAYEISQNLRSIRHSRFVFASALLLPLGKALLAVLFPKGGSGESWISVMADCGKFGRAKRDAEEFFEKKRFGTSHPELAALYVKAFRVLDEVEPAIRFAREPWMLMNDPDQYQLARILSSAVALTAKTEGKPE